ncbi:Chromosome segregation ATPase [Elusimicrobium minutum Pei191]|uniref:Chromosome partition protein Smc n=1 Tax=Elusimicrobium minutum (strain Pei191) TaxID=445932 RepID=B2KBE7_ELUMP|nr:AAA family ATPase [Elusimicrobium minutum]ACC97969.1 Chromosome segregation ATPase [Elusimicrobium minutum Pei191]
MYLKAIEIIGFKSFADRQRLDFEKGITCVVGPNGCGKSNVVDSVRWAIGEMSWKSLRSASMIDIIFNGTARRSPLNLAQVNMIFDNESRKLPLDFNEITVSRKIFRSGESEYFLNKVQCRLRDIRDLFLDTGIGGEGYAIIDQGGVESVLSASAEQRREMFEEVAGVSKYKAKREEAIRRLDRVDLDIARLSDTVVLLDEQIKKLDTEAKKARLYQKYREELKESEIAISLESIKEFDANIVKDSAELEPLIKQIEDLNNNTSAVEGSVAALDLNLTHKQKQLGEFNEKISTIKYQIGVLEGAVKNCENLTIELTAQITYSASEGQRGQNRLKEITPIISGFKEKLNAIEAELLPLQKKYNDQFALVKENEEALKNVDITSQQLNTNLMRAVQAEMELSNKIALEESSAAHEQQNLITLEKSGAGNNENLENLKKTLENISEKITEKHASLEGVKNQLNEAEEKTRSLSRSRIVLNDQLSASKAQAAALNARLEMIQSQGKNDPYWVGAKLIEEAGIPGVKGTLRKNIKFSSSDNLIIEEAFGKFLDSVICDTLQTADLALEKLKAANNARCKFIILSEVPETPATGDVKNLIKYPSGLERLINCLSNSNVSGGTVKGGFWISGGAQNIKVPEAYWGEEESVKDEINSVKEKAASITKQIEENAADINNAENNLKTLRTRFQEESISLNSFKNDLASREREIKNIEQSLEAISKNKESLLNKVSERKNKSEELRKQLSEIKASQDKIKAEIDAAKSAKAKIVQDGEGLRTEISRVNADLYEVKLKKNNIEVDLRSTEFEYNNIIEADKKRQDQITAGNERIKALSEEKLTAQAQLSTQREDLKTLELDQTKLASELQALKKDFDEKSTKLNEYKKRQSDMQLRAHDLENALTNYRRQRTTIVNHLMESWNITPEEAAMKFTNKEIDHERVKMMRKRIENMGAVNMTAPEEYDALNERATFLKKQIEDLENAKRDLKTAINKINATTKENFKYTFDHVRNHFKNIYQTLFRGGEADLVLTDPENLLETGIEIYAQPPGKKLLNLSAMSGGEKTLTALSLLFAFFTHNPAPFCVLDEADAALDEANVERYVNLIKEFSNTTQFIVVTHNKRTMEAAQMLYGITMEESGISKVMSVNMKEESAKLDELVNA